MWKEAVHAVLGPVAKALVVASVRRDEDLAAPTGPAISHGSGPDPDRVLVIGGMIVRGLGVAAFDLALTGHLARRLAHRTGRGADVEVRAAGKYDIHRAAELVRRENLARFDLVLIMMGISEIISMRPTSAFRRDIRMLLTTIAETAPHGLPVHIAGVAPFMQDMNVPQFSVSWMERRIARQNAETRLACEESGVAEYVEFAPARAGIRTGGDASAVYESWAVALAPEIELALAHREARSVPVLDEAERQRAFNALDLDAVPDANMDRIVEMARDMLGADVASLNLIDNDRQWSKATAGHEPIDLPRSEGICNVTIMTPGAHVVEDLDADPAFSAKGWLQGANHPRFYAGYPLEAPGGQRIGALCVMNRAPRQFTADETATLRDLALRAQAVLWQKAG